MDDIGMENAILAQLRFGIDDIAKQMELVEQMARQAAINAQNAFKNTNLLAPVNTQAMTAQQAMVARIMAEGETNKARIMAEGEAKISSIQAKEALTRQQIAQKEAATQLAIIKQQMAQEQILYMQSRRAAFEDKPQGLAGLMERRVSWLGTGALVMGGFAGISETLSTIKDVEMGMTTIARVTEDATFSFKGMRDELQQLGVTYGDTWGDVSDIAIRWAQAGYNMQDTLELTKDSLLALNTAELNSEQATSGMIAIMAQWGLTASELLPVIDKINKVADDFAITSTDLVSGLQRSSGAAKVLGLSLEETIAILTTMREATGRTGKEVGNALNSILSFMQRPTAIKAFETEGIQVFADEARTQFRNVIEIFDEMSQKWPKMGEASRNAFADQAEAAGLYSEEMAEVLGMEEQYNDIQQRNLSQAAAGIYRRNYLLALLQNWSKVDEVLIAQENSLGYSLKENERTMQTLEKQIEVLKASAEQLAVALGDAGLLREITGLVEGVTDVVQWFNNLDDTTQTVLLTLIEVTAAVKLLSLAFKGLGVSGAIAGAGGLMAGWTVPIGATTAATRTLMSTLAGLSALLANLSRGILAAFGGPVVAGIIAVSTAAIAVARNVASANEELIEHGQIAENLIGDYDKLNGKLEGMTKGTSEYNQAVKELSGLKNNIANALPEVIDGWDSETDSVKINREEMEKLIVASKDLKKSQEDLTESLENTIKAMQAEVAEYNKQAQEWENEKNVLQDLADRRDKLTEALSRQKEGSEEAKKTEEALGEAERLIADIAEEAGLKRNATVDEIIDKLNKLKVAENQAAINTQTAELNKTKAVKEAAIARLKIIQQEIDAYNDPMSWGFMQAAGNFLKQINPLNRYNKDPKQLNLDNLKKEKVKSVKAAEEAKKQIESIEKAIKESQRNIAAINADIITGSGGDTGDSGGSSSGSAKNTDWLTSFVDNALAAAEAQARLTAAQEREMSALEAEHNLYKDNAMTLQEYTKGLQIQAGAESLLIKHQEQLHAEANAYREAIIILGEKQKTLNLSTEEGQKAYQKIGDEIDKARQKVDELGIAWLRDEGNRRVIPTEQYREMTQWVDKLVNMGAINLEQQYKIYEAVDKTKLVYSEQVSLTEKQIGLGKQLLEQAVEKQIASIKEAKEASKAASDARIKALQTQIDLMNKQNEAAREQQAIQESVQKIAEEQKNLADAQAKLSNVQDEKNTRIFQNGRWEYIADPKAVRDAQKEVEDAQQKIIDARNAFNEKMADITRRNQERELQEQIEAERKKQEEQEKAYDEQIKQLQDYFKTFLEGVIAGNVQLNSQTDKDLKALGITFDDNLNTILASIQIWASRARSEIQSVLEMSASAGGPIFLPGFAKGGPIPADMAIQAHAGEYMLNAKDVQKMGGYSGVERLLSALHFPSMNANNVVKSSSVSSSVTHDNRIQGLSVSLPNVYDASGFIRNLKQLAVS